MIIPWMGGKRRLANQILPIFPPHKCYVEPFAGGAALFFMKQPSETEVINDINGELINLYRVVQNHLEEFVRQFKWALSSRQLFEWHKATTTETLTDIQRAARFFYLQKSAFGSRCDNPSYGTATTASPNLNLLRIEEDLSAAHLRLSKTYIEHLPWNEVIQRYDRPHTLFYLDPPYWQTAGYGTKFEFEHYKQMADLAGSIQGAMIISINDHPEIREVFSSLDYKEVSIKYTVGENNNTDSTELIYWNKKVNSTTVSQNLNIF